MKANLQSIKGGNYIFDIDILNHLKSNAFNLKYKRNGEGSLRVRLPNGDFQRLCTGEWRNNHKFNHGREYFPDGVYSGEYLNGNRSGNGIMWYYENNSMYIGHWKLDKHHGAGVLFNG